MIAELLPKLAGMERQERGLYFPRPSLSGPERCIRQMVYWGLGTPEDRVMGNRFILTIDDSTFHEYLTHDWISKSAFKIHSAQMPLDIATLDFIEHGQTRHCKHCGKEVPTNILHGHPDGIITDLLMHDRHYEHKGINRFAFERYWKGNFPLDYITQCCLCIKGINHDLTDKIDESILLMKCKDTARYMEFLINYNEGEDAARVMEATLSSGEKKTGKDGTPLLFVPNIVRDAIDKFRLVDAYIFLKELPDRPYDFGTDFPCGYCSWEETCWKGYAAEVKELSENEADLTELADTARFYKELGAQISDMEKQKDEVKAKITEKLKDLKARKGRAGEYVIEYKLSEVTRVKKKDDIPEELLPRVTETKYQETLYITKFKEKKERGKK